MTTTTMREAAPAGRLRAVDYAASFTWAKRDNEEELSIFWHHKEDTPELYKEITRDAHDDELPNDWRYATCSEIADAIVEGDFQSHEDVVDAAHEIAASIVEPYTLDLLTWGRHLNRTHYLNAILAEVAGTGEVLDTWAAMTRAQHACIEQMIYTIANALFEDTGHSQSISWDEAE